MPFLTINNFFCGFSKIPTKRTFVRLLFLKQNQSRNKKKIFFWGFLQKPKTHFFGGPKWYFLKVKFQICTSAFVLYCKRKLHANFHKKYKYLSPLEFLENENFDVHELVLATKFWNSTSKIIRVPDLWLLDLFCPIKKISTLHPTVQAHKVKNLRS